MRPESLHTLDDLGALKYALSFPAASGNSGCITHMKRGTTINEYDHSIFQWPLQRYKPAGGLEPAKAEGDYVSPNSIQEQVPSCFVRLGDLEDCLSQAAKVTGVEIIYETTVILTKEDDTDVYIATSRDAAKNTIHLGRPDLIVCASGKNDFDLHSELGMMRHEAILLTGQNMPDPSSDVDSFALPFNEEQDLAIERQLMSVFGVRTAVTEAGVLDHFTRKYSPDDAERELCTQPVIEIKMTESDSTTLLLQISRPTCDVNTSSAAIQSHVLSRINSLLKTSYTSLGSIKQENLIVWGDPSKPISITTSTAPRYVYGTNVILVGDCAMSCSPNSGIGADIALTVDSASIKTLAQALATESDKTMRRKALIDFNMKKADSAIIWSQGSSLFYATEDEVNKILKNELIEEPKLVGIQRAMFTAYQPKASL